MSHDTSSRARARRIPPRHATWEDTRLVKWLEEQDGEQQVFRDVRRRRRCGPRLAEGYQGQRGQNNGRKRPDDGEGHRRGEQGPGRTRVMALRPGAAIIGRRLRHPGRGCAVVVMVKRTRAILAALPPRFGRRLPPGALGDRALREREHAHHRRQTAREPSHIIRMRRTPRRVNRRLRRCHSASESHARLSSSMIDARSIARPSCGL